MCFALTAFMSLSYLFAVYHDVFSGSLLFIYFHRTSWICGLMSSIHLGGFWPLFLHILLLPLSFSSKISVTHTCDFISYLGSFSIFVIYFSMCFNMGIFRSLFFHFALSNLLLSSSTEFQTLWIKNCRDSGWFCFLPKEPNFSAGRQLE